MKAKFSLRELFDDSKVAILRFPLVLLSAILSGSIGIYAVHSNIDLPETLGYLMAVIGLGISVFFAITVFFENNPFGRFYRMVVELLAIGLLFLIYLQVKSSANFGFENTVLLLLRYALLSHLLVAFSPFLSKRNEISFWHYNRIMLIRVILTAVFVVCLYIGLSAAAAAIQTLFGINIPNQFYFDLMVLLFGPVSVIFFCAGIPKNLSQLESSQEFPNVIRIFVQFVLIPLVIVYFIIMYAYFGKIVMEWNLPKGFLTYFINANLVIGILSYLLIFPYKLHVNNKLITVYLSNFFLVLIPVIGMQLVGIITRLVDYGFTEERYLVLLVALWVVFLILYFQFSKKKNTITIPLSMFAVVLVSTIGPISSQSITKMSQTSRIQQTLLDLKMIENKKLIAFKQNKEDTLMLKKAIQLANDIEFMVREFGITGAEPYLTLTPNEIVCKKLNGMNQSIRSHEKFNIQREELTLLFEKYGLNNLEYNVVSEDDFMSFVSRNFKFPFPIHNLIGNVHFYVDENYNNDSSCSVIVRNHVTFLKIKTARNEFEFDMSLIFKTFQSNQNLFLIATDPNKKAIFLIQELQFNRKQKQIKMVKGQLFD